MSPRGVRISSANFKFSDDLAARVPKGSGVVVSSWDVLPRRVKGEHADGYGPCACRRVPEVDTRVEDRTVAVHIIGNQDRGASR